MRKTIRMLIGLLITLPFASAHAASYVTGKVQRLFTINLANAQDQGANIALVGITGQIVAKAPCNTANEWAFSLKDPSGRAMFAQLLHAQSSGLSVTMVGDGTCSTWGDRERPLYMYVDYPVP